ncbi:hypothetical protein BH23VER1_BH23VER1_18190 [soil metagenome]
MSRKKFDSAVREVVERDPRFRPDSYAFLRDALDFTMRRRAKTLAERDAENPGDGLPTDLVGEDEASPTSAHVSGEELLDGFREYALREFGPMAMAVLDDWGITCSADVGTMVFNLIDAGIFGKSAEDSPEDFREVLDFEKAFVAPFRPVTARVTKPAAGPPAARRGKGAKPETRENS